MFRDESRRGERKSCAVLVERLRADFALQRLVQAERLPYVRLETVGKRADIVTNIIFMVTKQHR
jgi:hypothetical protein